MPSLVEFGTKGYLVVKDVFLPGYGYFKSSAALLHEEIDVPCVALPLDGVPELDFLGAFAC